MPHTIVKDICEGEGTCVNACPVACIKQGIGKNIKSKNYYFIEFSTCIDCGVCLEVCPVKDAVISEERPDLQGNQGN
ncbi:MULTISPECIES: indolepyruvate ferredoxin oxidoreductase subunit alpha [Prochlorococcus]|uniref:indolepyruvate ferredoxin oxidoreductase subunit alpha n=1 Tax=Prochlorococcus TaxID=1218 RepID=UPI0005338025|nr:MULTISPECIES: 4Fe-4S dicluster domain-containing protein [Prochlorococcus]KGG12484.1 Ferredoxin [Prochlorococcus sp. MIT 0601]